MSDFKLMIVEDNDTDLDSCRDCIKDFEQEMGCNIELVICKTIDEAFKKLDMTFDGAIIDIKLDTQGTGDEGNKVLDEIKKTNLRIPVAVLTATPSSVDMKSNYIGVFKKGSSGSSYTDLLYQFWEIYNTGLTRIMGGRGKIEESLGRVFNENLMPEQYRKKWIEYGKEDASRTEKALLRHALSHLFQLLDDDCDSYLPEEVYLIPPLTSEIKTGCIVTEKESGCRFVVMTPACDLVIRTCGDRNTDRILIVNIDTLADVFPDYKEPGFKKNKLENAVKNKKSYYHFLPETNFFDGGFVNFRKLSTLEIDKFKTQYGEPIIQISPSFVKDMVARFSAYYARQGQPEINFSSFLNPVQPMQEKT